MSLFNQLNAQGGILRAALIGSAKRNEVIVNNIANADVPGFRARRVEFENSLREAVGNYPHPRHRNVDTSGVTATVHFQNPGTHYRIDGNNVDIEVEMVRLYQNSMKFDTLISSITANSQRMRTVLQQGQ
jgi:flagellar basal-body rod protein FlgB